MEGKAGTQVASPFLSQQFTKFPFYDMAAKRCSEPMDSTWIRANWQPQQQMTMSESARQRNATNWNPNGWEWDSVRFVGRPLDDTARNGPPLPSDELQLGSASASPPLDQKRRVRNFLEDDGGGLTLKLGSYDDSGTTANGIANSCNGGNSGARQSKRVRSGSPGSNYPMCQVDDCRADLTCAKDYHRRHKVCETHSKAANALVGNVHQRFCQQCSRFHPLQEFDEGKRSCRRRLAGHNRRRRKTQPEDALTRGLLAATQENGGTLGNLDIVSIISVLTRIQGNAALEKAAAQLPLEKDHLLQLLSKVSVLSSQSASNPSSVAPQTQGFDLNVSENVQSNSAEASKASTPQQPTLTTELLAILSALAGSSPELLSLLRNTLAANLDANAKSQSQSPSVLDLPKLQEQRQKSNFVFSSCGNSKVDSAASRLPLQLFGSCHESFQVTIAASKKHVSSGSSSPAEEASPSSSPVIVQKLFPVQSRAENRETEETSPSDDRCSPPTNFVKCINMSSQGNGSLMSRSLHRTSDARSPMLQNGYTSSSSGSDLSPASSNSDSQDRTGRIIFKLFGKDPSNFPGTLRAEILEWLSRSPSEMESYIRPGCVILSIFVSMPSSSWEQLLENLPQRVKALIEESCSDFWRTGRLLLQVDQYLVSAKDGKVRLSSAWRSWNAPEIHFLQPFAVVAGKETTIILKGRNLANPGTKILCAYKGKYTSEDVPSTDHTSLGVIVNQRIQSFKFKGSDSNEFGRCFIEVEHGFKGNSFPVIIADSSICKELQNLESILEAGFIEDKDCQDYDQGIAKEEVITFLNELGWLFQRSNRNLLNRNAEVEDSIYEFSKERYKFLFTFAVERDMTSLVKKLLAIYFEEENNKEISEQNSAKTVLEINLLHRAVKRKCRVMVQILINYSDPIKGFVFSPNAAGPGGLTPLHLAACLQDAEELVHALTNDPQNIGLQCWRVSMDSSGQTPYDYATMKNNHNYNTLIERKISDKRNGQISIPITSRDLSIDNALTETSPSCSGLREYGSLSTSQRLPQSCVQCMIRNPRIIRRIPGRQGVLYRPYVHSMLAVAAVCVCVCLLLRGAPEIGSVAPFKWENVGYGPR